VAHLHPTCQDSGVNILPVHGTCDFLALHARDPVKYPALLESVATNSTTGRHDILFACPAGRLELTGHGLRRDGRAQSGGFLAALRAWWSAERLAAPSTSGLPFGGGWLLFLAYEFAGEIEAGLRLPAPADVPLALAVRARAALIREHGSGAVHAVAEDGCEEALAGLLHDVAATAVKPPEGETPGACSTHEPPAGDFIEAVRRAKREIAEGNVYQVNLSREWTAHSREALSAIGLYRRLRTANPAPFAGILRIGTTSVLSSSPERLVAAGAGRVRTRPIAGTRPRLDPADPGEAQRQELLANAKERAEHVMLIDLERNDLGRICRPGTVQVDEFMALESYAHVHHLVSNVTGKLRPDVTPADIIRAVFPGGTITGCPKVRALAVIRDLERRARGAYTGSFGYLGRDGQMDLNILIRTMTVSGRQVSFAAGSGIVADSDPERELDESRAKAKGMLLALESP
jgi:anthranilate synthase component 1